MKKQRGDNVEGNRGRLEKRAKQEGGSGNVTTRVENEKQLKKSGEKSKSGH